MGVYRRLWKPTDIMSLSYIAPLLELAQNEMVQSKIEEAAKLFYSSDTVTVNLIPVIVAAGLLALLAIPLLALYFQPHEEEYSYGTGYGGGYGVSEYRSDEGYEEDAGGGGSYSLQSY